MRRNDGFRRLARLKALGSVFGWIRIAERIRDVRFGWYRPAWQRFVGIRRRKQHGREDDRALLHILDSQVIVSVEIRVMYAREVIQGVLDELKSGQSQRAEPLMIGRIR